MKYVVILDVDEEKLKISTDRDGSLTELIKEEIKWIAQSGITLSSIEKGRTFFEAFIRKDIKNQAYQHGKELEEEQIVEISNTLLNVDHVWQNYEQLLHLIFSKNFIKEV